MEIKPTRPAMPDYERYVEEIRSIWDTGILTNYGEKTEKLKQMLSEYTGIPNISLFVNGHSALLLAMQILNLKGEVITSPFTFISTTNAIVQNHLIPVFGDIDDTYNLNPACIEELITPDTCAIVTPHIFGIPCDVAEIEKIAQRHGLKVIYDGAQAFGTKVNGKSIGCFGDITMFSFHAIKVYHTIEGGMLSYHDSSMGRKLQQYRNFGISYDADNGNDVLYEGINAKMNEFQAAMGIVNLPYLQREIAQRKKLAEIYIEQLRDVPGISTYAYEEEIDYNYAYFPVLVHKGFGRTRNQLWEYLRGRGIGSRKLYDRLTCDYSIYKNRNYKRMTVNADKVKQECLDLPIYGSLTDSEVEYICQTIRNFRWQ
ncbi:MAG: DegT/DnrJ/EryC1/StrS family aminotransferase [Lachnospiraceae bacterium]|nr:DegT/DnrJ/EryC1/StrS family aminotransferase [Lachnospiraceae bacterium]